MVEEKIGTIVGPLRTGDDGNRESEREEVKRQFRLIRSEKPLLFPLTVEGITVSEGKGTAAWLGELTGHRTLGGGDLNTLRKLFDLMLLVPGDRTRSMLDMLFKAMEKGKDEVGEWRLAPVVLAPDFAGDIENFPASRVEKLLRIPCIYFVPFGRRCRYNLLAASVFKALRGERIQPQLLFEGESVFEF